jgi:hypothetical protein
MLYTQGVRHLLSNEDNTPPLLKVEEQAYSIGMDIAKIVWSASTKAKKKERNQEMFRGSL